MSLCNNFSIGFGMFFDDVGLAVFEPGGFEDPVGQRFGDGEAAFRLA